MSVVGLYVGDEREVEMRESADAVKGLCVVCFDPEGIQQIDFGLHSLLHVYIVSRDSWVVGEYVPSSIDYEYEQ